MSNYRDDIQETAIASSSTWGGLQTITSESAKIAAATIFTLGVLHTDRATASDEVFDRALHVVHEQAVVSDTVLDHAMAAAVVDDFAHIGEQFTHATRVIHDEQATASDAVFHQQSGSVLSDSAIASDAVYDHRTCTDTVEDWATIADHSGQFSSVMVEETAVLSDSAYGYLHAVYVVEDQALLSDEVISSGAGSSILVSDSAVVSDTVSDLLRAASIVTEWASVTDEVLGGADTGQAWTACTDGWAMSRYQPYTFSRIAVIDGVLYGETENGVYALSGGVETVEARVRTGKLDMSGGPLTHPVAAYMEYELAGTAEMDVTTTQTGTPQSYTYSLPPESAEHLTNGRFQFGRGLRGRHFTFELKITGEHGRVNDLTIQTAQGRRRI